MANSLIFLLIGLAAGAVPFARVEPPSLAVIVALVLLARAATVYPLWLAVRPHMLGGPAAGAARAPVGRPARGAVSGARPVAARPGTPRRNRHRGLRRGGVLDRRRGDDHAADAQAVGLHRARSRETTLGLCSIGFTRSIPAAHFSTDCPASLDLLGRLTGTKPEAPVALLDGAPGGDTGSAGRRTVRDRVRSAAKLYRFSPTMLTPA